jgi:GAF domain-containing protein
VVRRRRFAAKSGRVADPGDGPYVRSDGASGSGASTHSHDERVGAADELYELLTATDTFEAFLLELAVLAAREVGGELSCGITARPDQRPATVASSDTLAGRLDELQYADGIGPCMHALNTGEVVQIDDLAADERWGVYRSDAYAHGLRSSLSMPIGANGQIVGALNLYSTAPRGFTDGHRRRAARFADRAAGALSVAARISAQTRLSMQLQQALESRAVIDQAIGVVMAQRRCSPEQAFAVLRAASQNRNIKLRVVATGIVSSLQHQAPHHPDGPDPTGP